MLTTPVDDSTDDEGTVDDQVQVKRGSLRESGTLKAANRGQAGSAQGAQSGSKRKGSQNDGVADDGVSADDLYHPNHAVL